MSSTFYGDWLKARHLCSALCLTTELVTQEEVQKFENVVFFWSLTDMYADSRIN